MSSDITYAVDKYGIVHIVKEGMHFKNGHVLNVGEDVDNADTED